MSGIPSPLPGRSGNGDRDKDNMWHFTAEDLSNSPSRRNGISPDMELSYRQMTAYLIQEMGQRLQVSQLCINTAIVYMHRFYAFHSFTHFHRNGIAAASLFLAAKVEEQPRKLEHVIKAANQCLKTNETNYVEQAQDLVFNENVLLQTLGFDVAIDHPHTHVVKTCHLVKAGKDLAQTSYFLASNSLHLTSMCLQYKPTVVACFCIYLACKWSRWEIPQSTEGKHWFHYVDETVTMDLLKKLTDEFIAIYEKSPARLKAKLTTLKAIAQGASNRQNQPKDDKSDQDWKVSDMMKMYHPPDNSCASTSQQSSSQYSMQGQSSNEQPSQSLPPAMPPPPPHQPPTQMRKSDKHSSSNQHRTHHSSSSSSHHPPKMGYPTGDIPDHKLSGSHKQPQQQPPYGANLVNRPREHSSSGHNAALIPSSSKASSSARSSICNTLPGQSMSRLPSQQSHSMDVAYHKSRDRSLVPPATHNLPPHGITHKMGQKQPDPNRPLVKDHSGRLPLEQQPKQAGSSNKMFSSSSSAAYGSNQQIPPGGSNLSGSKMEGLHDMSRSMMHSSRGYGQAPPPPSSQHPTNGPSTNLLSFHQQQQGSRHSNSNNNTISNSSSLKHEQSKQQISVHMQQPAQSSTHHHKQIPIPDTSYSGLPAPHELQQHQSHSSSMLGSSYCKIEPMQQNSDDMPQFAAQAQSTVTKTSSMFSPDWNQEVPQQPTKQHQIPTLNFSNNGNMPPTSDSYGGYKLTGSKDSPPKVKTERDGLSKKDKNRSSLQHESAYNMTGRNLSATNQAAMKLSQGNKLDQMGPGELAGTSSMTVNAMAGKAGGVKRSNESLGIKLEEEMLQRDSKVRKMDVVGEANKHHQVVNGIETNPDLVRNLLKESLCPPSALLKTENSIITPSLQPPAELFEPSATTSTQNVSMNSSTISQAAAAVSSNSDVSAMEVDEHGPSGSGSKSEKKKKKEKHKHKEKEKDKTKDREERKKHKKDKDRHKEKERERENDPAEHVKIKISKEKLESTGEPIGFKIKIPKDRILGDLSTSSASSHTAMESGATHAPPVLKIKILKDKLESYSSGPTSDASGMIAQPSYIHGGQSSAYAPYSTSHSSSSTTHASSSKRKDREREKDRDRERERKRPHDSSSKSNGGGSNSSSSLMSTSATVVSATANGSVQGAHGSSSSSSATASQRNHQPSKIHHQSNMSLLFGESNESNDDDDDDY